MKLIAKTKDGYGGVLLAIKKDFIINNITISQENECEVAFAKLTFGKNQTLIVEAAHRPPNSDASYNERMCKAFKEISNSNKHAVIWIGGDFNLPDINCNSISVNGNHNLLQMNNKFLEMIQNCNLDQVMKLLSRLDNTLDLFSTNRHSLINRCTPIPGIADHDIVFIESPIIGVT